MKNFFLSLSFGKLRENIVTALIRFPIAIALSLGIAILFFLQLHGNLDLSTESIVFRMIFSAIVTFFFSVGVSLQSESHDASYVKNYSLQSIPVAFGALYYTGFSTNFDNERNAVLFLLTFSGIVAYLFFAPFIRKFFMQDRSQEAYYAFFYTIATVFLLSLILGGVPALLGNIAIWSILSLFDLKSILSDKAYGDWMIVALSILSPFFALTKLPSREICETHRLDENVFFSLLIKYIAIPFIFLYFIILYIYTAKVLKNFFEWPKWEVCWMVIGFSLFGYMSYIFSYILEARNRFIWFFRRWFPVVVIPQLGMLAYAIYLRIAQYDMTINRYFVVVFGIWLLVVSLYLLISSKKYLGFIPAILALFTVMISIGPWSVYAFPMARQIARLETNLVQAKILQSGKIVPLNTYGDIDRKLSKEIYEWIDYLCGFDDCGYIKTRFAEQYSKIELDTRVEHEHQKAKSLKNAVNAEQKKIIEAQKYEIPQKWTIVQKIGEMIRVQSYYGISDDNQPYISLRLADNINIYPIDTRWYGQLYRINDYKTIDPKNEVRAEYDASISAIVFKRGTETIDTIDLTEKFKILQKAYKKTRESQFSINDMTFVYGKYRVLFEGIAIKNLEYKDDGTKTDDDYINSYMNGFVLVK